MKAFGLHLRRILGIRHCALSFDVVRCIPYLGDTAETAGKGSEAATRVERFPETLIVYPRGSFVVLRDKAAWLRGFVP
jgi:hypothetical protein